MNNHLDDPQTMEEMKLKLDELRQEILFWQIQWHKLAAAFKKFSRERTEGYDFANESNDQSNMRYN